MACTAAAAAARVGVWRSMLGYLVHRILIMIPTLIAISMLIFIIIHLPPGDYFSTYIAELQSQGEGANLAKIAFLKAQYGFDLPLWEQYLYWAITAGRSRIAP